MSAPTLDDALEDALEDALRRLRTAEFRAGAWGDESKEGRFRDQATAAESEVRAIVDALHQRVATLEAERQAWLDREDDRRFEYNTRGSE